MVPECGVRGWLSQESQSEPEISQNSDRAAVSMWVGVLASCFLGA